MKQSNCGKIREMALPCYTDYYIVAQLRVLVCWCNPNYSACWKDIESSLSGDVLVQTLISAYWVIITNSELIDFQSSQHIIHIVV